MDVKIGVGGCLACGFDIIPNGSMSCPNCGDKFDPCPKCGGWPVLVTGLQLGVGFTIECRACGEIWIES
jgi:hypothetical protein